MANLEVMALDAATPQLRAPGAGDGYSMPRPITMSFGAITSQLPFLNALVEWNNAGVNFNAITVNVIKTAWGVGSSILSIQTNGVENLKIDSNCSIATDRQIYDLAGGGSNLILDSSGYLQLGTVRLIKGNPTVYLACDNGSGTLRGFQGAYLRTVPVTVGTLTAGVIVKQGARSFVTDATLGIIAGLGTVVAGGGANAVPVYYDGANWIIG
jgi:hypothetical protein